MDNLMANPEKIERILVFTECVYKKNIIFCQNIFQKSIWLYEGGYSFFRRKYEKKIMKSFLFDDSLLGSYFLTQLP